MIILTLSQKRNHFEMKFLYLNLFVHSSPFFILDSKKIERFQKVKVYFALKVLVNSKSQDET